VNPSHSFFSGPPKEPYFPPPPHFSTLFFSTCGLFKFSLSPVQAFWQGLSPTFFLRFFAVHPSFPPIFFSTNPPPTLFFFRKQCISPPGSVRPLIEIPFMATGGVQLLVLLLFFFFFFFFDFMDDVPRGLVTHPTKGRPSLY